ncbi:hypothetical protein GCM10007989_03110 [Devosia pacifica]|uniref:Ribonuclease E n=1 Tax=Devosia pacifica TaxID=1335967 RepID=A0A918RTD4_9HYPH|nr:ribonuclease E/G [Devosia pacifica]GHA12089.1 hypothetical protein GCM10007989_03110 [Devosia pacifica]
MATKRMLVDAIHPEETRIVVTSGNKLEDFDFESASRRQLRGNIYLAKVTRVEPSLQAAFVEYGGNRHGFLAFSEIHPDYYQIPVADREALIQAEEAEHSRHNDHDDDHVSVPEGVSEPAADSDPQDPPENGEHRESVESVGGGDALEEVPERKRNLMRRYKIQEVIKRRQVMLVQVVKEERGNKGAALTTYLSLAGRYSVLMPNTARGGGISRKITNAADRKRLKEITSDLSVPQGMGVILRTAGASRTKAEVKRDFEYLMRLWENVRNLTLQSQAPCLVYEEGSLIKRTIRDLYNKDIAEVLVAGEDAYREAKDFMKMIMPSHAENVKLYADEQPLFSRFTVEGQLDQMFSPQVTLPSGGYLVINPTEALVSIDVNSGRSTKEHNIEDTALQTNLEAAEEVARQLRLRDLAGLIVIDFIDMMENRSNRAVERKLKECLKDDRARIQVGRISHFGLMEMSRQRIRFGVVESSTHKCPICDGTGLVRSTESVALMVMRHVEDHVLRKPGQSLNVHVPVDVALYILNYKRDTLTTLEGRHALSITITADPKLTASQFNLERTEQRAGFVAEVRETAPVRVDSTDFDEIEEEETEAEETAPAEQENEGSSSRRKRRRRRRGGNNGNGERHEEAAVNTKTSEAADDETSDDQEAAEASQDNADDDKGENRKRRRRGRRGGRRNRRNEGETEGTSAATDSENADAQAAVPAQSEGEVPADAHPANADLERPQAVEEPSASIEQPDLAASQAPEPSPAEDAQPAEKPKRRRRTKKQTEAETVAQAAAAVADAPEADAVEAEPAKQEKPKRKPRSRRKTSAPAEEAPTPAAEPEGAAEGQPEMSAPEAVEPVVEEAVSAADRPAPEPAPTAEGEDTTAEGERPVRARPDLPEEGIVVSSSTGTSEDKGEPEKKKRGWWQRRLGLG